MPKPNPSKTMPWPENLIYDFHLSPDTTSEAAEAFINGLATSKRNKAFLRLRYFEGKAYSEIGAQYGITPTGVRLAIKGLWEKHGGVTAPATAVPAADDTAPAVPAAEDHTAEGAHVDTSSTSSDGELLIVDPAALNGIALIETIRVLYRKVGPANFEDALTELRDCIASLLPRKEQ